MLIDEVGGMLKRKIQQGSLRIKQDKLCPISGTIQLYLEKIKGSSVKTGYVPALF
jgi:hypothetical protein